MKYVHRFRVTAALDEVAAFHRQASSMAAITPPPGRVVMHETPAVLTDGAEMEFSLWLGPLPIRWRARIENVSANGFDDRLVRGPFRAWNHRHSFVSLPHSEVEIVDEIHAELKPSLGSAALGLLMWLNLPVLFAYRAWQTRRLLALRASGHDTDIAHSERQQS